jgi:hypothetical protein
MACVKLASAVQILHVGGLPAFGFFRLAEFHEGCYQNHTNPLNCRTGSSGISGYHAEFHEGCYQKHTDPLNCRTSISDISSYYAVFHEGHDTVRSWQRRGLACVN